MRIDVITVITGLDEAAIERRRRALSRFASPGTEVRPVITRRAPASVESHAELELAAEGILEQVVESERSGADAVVIWGGHDPSLEAARELVSIPVVGPGMASMYLAVSLADRFSLLVQLPNVIGVARRQVRELGLAERCASIRSVDVPVLALDRDAALEPMLERAVKAVVEDGADAICFGCMAMTSHAPRLAEALSERLPGVLVIDPGLAAIRWAELLIGMGLSHSKRSYPYPPKAIRFLD